MHNFRLHTFYHCYLFSRCLFVGSLNRKCECQGSATSYKLHSRPSRSSICSILRGGPLRCLLLRAPPSEVAVFMLQLLHIESCCWSCTGLLHDTHVSSSPWAGWERAKCLISGCTSSLRLSSATYTISSVVWSCCLHLCLFFNAVRKSDYTTLVCWCDVIHATGGHFPIIFN